MAKTQNKYAGGKSFRATHKSEMNATYSKRDRLFDDFRKEFFGEKSDSDLITHANDNPIEGYAYRK